jgi:hypothetical protein
MVSEAERARPIQDINDPSPGKPGRSTTNFSFSDMASSTKTVLLVTGANTGLGYQIVRALCQSNQSYDILLGGRSLEKAQQASSLLQQASNGQFWYSSSRFSCNPAFHA